LVRRLQQEPAELDDRLIKTAQSATAAQGEDLGFRFLSEDGGDHGDSDMIRPLR
jgi:hypothetical protein